MLCPCFVYSETHGYVKNLPTACRFNSLSIRYCGYGKSRNSQISPKMFKLSRGNDFVLSKGQGQGMGHRPNSKNVRCRQEQIKCASSSFQAADPRDVFLEQSEARLQSWKQVIYAFYKFTRPHTMIGTAAGVVSVSLLAIKNEVMSSSGLYGLAYALSAALLMNIAIVGINQIFDIKIDKINKPYLPLASGEFSVGTGIGIVVTTAICSLLIGVLSTSWTLFATLSISLLLGIAYSVDVPWLRWKRYPVLAAACILAVRAVIVQWGFYSHMKYSLGSISTGVSSSLIFVLGFMLLFSIVIALFKDIPDVAGDRKMGIFTLTVRLGQKAVFWTCISILLCAYFGAVIYCLLAGNTIAAKLTGVAGHLLFATLLFQNARNVDLTSFKNIYSCYMFVWKLFYAEYLIIPFLE
eukprot:TRINITY_DN726_c0_g1_i3.p1 TRINITY_DN726_c0_g1~~TRINITY_DN726_c0_g1_i3.p1  ORF type:complete len:409 (-),score=22.00 TRINITY_DN726_c0_g1_i3:1327-2553(-)